MVLDHGLRGVTALMVAGLVMRGYTYVLLLALPGVPVTAGRRILAVTWVC